jgi:YD repeat-containing protein
VSLFFGIGDSLGELTHTYDLKGRKTALSGPYFSQTCSYDAADNLIASTLDIEQRRFAYDGLSQLTHEEDHRYSYDQSGFGGSQVSEL